jgi:hypothetical protein
MPAAIHFTGKSRNFVYFQTVEPSVYEQKTARNTNHCAPVSDQVAGGLMPLAPEIKPNRRRAADVSRPA